MSRPDKVESHQHRGELCAAECDIAPSKRTPCLKNFFGGDLHETLVLKLDAAWKAKHPGKETSSLEISCIECGSDDENAKPNFGLCNPGPM